VRRQRPQWTAESRQRSRGGQGKKRGRGNRHRNGPKPDAAPADEAPRAPVPVIVDDDIGNR
jgi:hypothetical protein